MFIYHILQVEDWCMIRLLSPDDQTTKTDKFGRNEPKETFDSPFTTYEKVSLDNHKHL